MTALYAGNTLLGTLALEHMDHPGIYCRFEPTAEFEAFRRIMDLEGREISFQEHRAALEELDLRIVFDSGRVTKLSMIVIRGDRAMYRMGFIRGIGV